MSELKPCPFCGEFPIMQHEHDSLFDPGIFAYYVTCPKCGLRTQKNRSQSEVIKAWNRRVKDDEVLPSAQPEIVRCKDCKYYREYGYVNGKPKFLPKCTFSSIYVNADDFCSRAERRTDG